MEPVNAKLFEALAKTQSEIKSAKKSSENPFFKSSYADLEEVILSAQGPAGKNGISVIFDFKTEFIGEIPAMWIRYLLSHSSGEAFHSSWLLMMMAKKDAQGFGAACTYYRRQLLKSIFNIPETDNDAESIVERPQQSAPQVRPPNMAPNAARNAR